MGKKKQQTSIWLDPDLRDAVWEVTKQDRSLSLAHAIDAGLRMWLQSRVQAEGQPLKALTAPQGRATVDLTALNRRHQKLAMDFLTVLEAGTLDEELEQAIRHIIKSEVIKARTPPEEEDDNKNEPKPKKKTTA